jgi:hypothetical protein
VCQNTNFLVLCNNKLKKRKEKKKFISPRPRATCVKWRGCHSKLPPPCHNPSPVQYFGTHARTPKFVVICQNRNVWQGYGTRDKNWGKFSFFFWACIFGSQNRAKKSQAKHFSISKRKRVFQSQWNRIPSQSFGIPNPENLGHVPVSQKQVSVSKFRVQIHAALVIVATKQCRCPSFTAHMREAYITAWLC